MADPEYVALAEAKIARQAEILTTKNAEINRLRAVLRRCQRGVDLVEIAPGETVGLHLTPEVEARRRRGLPDHERPPLGQPPSWLQEQEKKCP
jgi:hypothetical protein